MVGAEVAEEEEEEAVVDEGITTGASTPEEEGTAELRTTGWSTYFVGVTWKNSTLGLKVSKALFDSRSAIMESKSFLTFLFESLRSLTKLAIYSLRCSPDDDPIRDR